MIISYNNVNLLFEICYINQFTINYIIHFLLTLVSGGNRTEDHTVSRELDDAFTIDLNKLLKKAVLIVNLLL